jgi:hypothetical protein
VTRGLICVAACLPVGFGVVAAQITESGATPGVDPKTAAQRRRSA